MAAPPGGRFVLASVLRECSASPATHFGKDDRRTDHVAKVLQRRKSSRRRSRGFRGGAREVKRREQGAITRHE